MSTTNPALDALRRNVTGRIEAGEAEAVTEIPAKVKRPTKKQLAAEERAEYQERLRAILPPGSTVYTVLRRMSSSGMMRHISLHVIEDGQLRDITGWAGLALGQPWNRDTGGIKVGGCGMDMGFHLVYNLAYTLYPQGFDCAGKGCPSNDHSNREENAHHQDGGYAFRHRWA